MREWLSRYQIIFPSEHGSWSMLLVPFLIGAGVGLFAASPAPGAGAAVLLCFLAVMSVFLARQPVALWDRIRRGRGRRAHLPAAIFWAAVLLANGAAAGTGLLALGRWPVLWLALPALGVLALTLALTALRGPRQLGVELIGVTGLALAAPAAYVSATARLDALAWLVWALSALHSVISVLYVRLRIDEQHQRATRRQAVWVVAAHALSVAGLAAAAAAGWLPWPVALPVGLLLVRALVAARRRPRIDDVKRFGFTEMGLGLAFALVVVVAFALLR